MPASQSDAGNVACVPTPPPCLRESYVFNLALICLSVADESCHHASPRPGAGAAITEGTPQPPPLCEDPPQGGHNCGAQGLLPQKGETPGGKGWGCYLSRQAVRILLERAVGGAGGTGFHSKSNNSLSSLCKHSATRKEQPI